MPAGPVSRIRMALGFRLVAFAPADGAQRCLELMTGKRLWETTDVMPKAWHATMDLVRAGDSGDRATNWGT